MANNANPVAVRTFVHTNGSTRYTIVRGAEIAMMASGSPRFFLVLHKAKSRIKRAERGEWAPISDNLPAGFKSWVEEAPPAQEAPAQAAPTPKPKVEDLEGSGAFNELTKLIGRMAAAEARLDDAAKAVAAIKAEMETRTHSLLLRLSELEDCVLESPAQEAPPKPPVDVRKDLAEAQNRLGKRKVA